MQTRKPWDFLYNHYILWSFLLTALISLVQCGVFYLQYGELAYIGTDCYTRALRILDWLGDFQWHEKIFPYFNPPDGFILHWTRICDVIWLVLAAPFLPFLPLKEAIFYGGMFFSPLFMALTLMALIWGIKPYLPQIKNRNFILLLFMFICLILMNKLTSAFDFSRPDHHSLMAWIMATGIAVILHNHLRCDYKNLLLLGGLCGLGIWASSAIEGLFVTGIILSVLAVNHIFYHHSSKELVYFSLGLFLSVAAAWLLNPPYDSYAVIDVKRLSVVHVVLTALMLMAFYILHKIPSKSAIIRILQFGCAAIIVALIMLLTFGVENIMVPIHNQVVYDVFIRHVMEMQPQPLFGYETPVFIVGLLSMMGLLYACRLRQPYIINIFIFFMLISLAALAHRRFFPYYTVIFAVVCGFSLFALINSAQKSDIGKSVTLFYVVAILLYLGSFNVEPQRRMIPVTQGPVLTDLMAAPELMFNKNIDAVGAPYHTNIEGISDNHTMWFTTDEQELKRLIRKHNVRVLYLQPQHCADDYAEPLANTDKLYGKVLSGQDLYPWLVKIDDGYYAIDYGEF